MMERAPSLGQVVRSPAGPGTVYTTSAILGGSYDADCSYGVGEVYGREGDGTLQLRRPSANNQPWQICAVLPGAEIVRSSTYPYRVAAFEQDARPVIVSITDDSDAPTIGSMLGTVAGSWKLKVGNYGFICVGIIEDAGKGSGGRRRVYARPFSQRQDRIVTLSGLSATLPSGGNGTFSQFNGSYSLQIVSGLSSGAIGPNLEPWSPSGGYSLSGQDFVWWHGHKYFVFGKNSDGKWSLHVMIGYYGSYGTSLAYRSSFIAGSAAALPWYTAYTYDVANSGTISNGGLTFATTAWGHEGTATCVITLP